MLLFRPVLFDNLSDSFACRSFWQVIYKFYFKNLIFKGGPNLNPGIISIRDESTLESNIDGFNENFSYSRIYVEKLDIISECKATIQKLDADGISNFDWLIKWMNKICP